MANAPYNQFGRQLKKIRTGAKKTISDVAAAIELDPRQLTALEAGRVRPSEEVIILLSSLLELPKDQAQELWQLAGYDETHLTSKTETSQSVQVKTYSPDSRIIYTDIVHVNANNYGVVVNFLQGLGKDDQPTMIARVGMSVEHANSLIKVLKDTVDRVISEQATDFDA